MIKIKYLIAGRDLSAFLCMLIIGGIFGVYLQAEVFQGNLCSNVVFILSILMGVNIISITTLYRSKILRNLFDRHDNRYGNSLNRIANYSYSFICFSLLSIILLLLLPSGFYGVQIKQPIVTAILFGSAFLFLKNLNYFFELFRFPRNE